MRMDIRDSLRYRMREERYRVDSCRDNIALGSIIKVKVGKKVIPMKTTTHRKGDMIEATANGKKYVCSWWDGQWTSSIKK